MHTAASCFTPFGCHKYTFWCKLTRIPRLHNTVLVFFYPIQIRIVSGLHYCGVNVHHVGVTFTLNWCSHSCKNLHFFGVTITLSLFLWLYKRELQWSSLEDTKTWTRISVVFKDGNFLLRKMLRGSYKADLQAELSWGSIVVVLSECPILFPAISLRKLSNEGFHLYQISLLFCWKQFMQNYTGGET